MKTNNHSDAISRGLDLRGGRGGLREALVAIVAKRRAEFDVARVIGIDPKTLRKHYRDELDNGQIKATAKVAESLFRKATSDGPQSVTAAIFWLKTKGGWREAPQVHEVGHYDVTKLTDEELEKMLLLTQEAIAESERQIGRRPRTLLLTS